MLTLADLASRAGLDVLSHLEREAAIPVTGGLQAQGDLIVVPVADLTQLTIVANAYWREVPGPGIDVLRAGAGGNPHTLVADPGACRWTTGVRDNTGLALGVLAATGVAYLIHPEHGGSGIAPGTYLIRRQRERGRLPPRLADTGIMSALITDLWRGTGGKTRTGADKLALVIGSAVQMNREQLDDQRMAARTP